jgi:PAS domain S-box-containing protein
MKTIRYSIFVFLQAIALNAVSQKQNIKFEHLGTEQGLSQSNVLCILQDSRGFMWFGTRDGLNKYDGYKFTIYKNKAGDKNSISNNYIQAIKESKDGYLWIATRGGGLNRYDRQKNQFISFKHDPKNKYSISSDIINTVLEDRQGNVWIGTEDGGLSMFDPEENQFTTYTYNRNDNNSLSDVFVRDIFEDSERNLWIATNNGGLNLFNRKNNTFTRFEHSETNSKSISGNNIYTMFEDSKHRFWIGTNGSGLDQLNRESGQFYHYKHDANNANSLANDYVHAINEDNKNNLWIGTENGGLSILDPENTFTNYASDEFDNSSLSNNSIYSICQDNKSNIWIGTFNAGLNIVNRDAVKFTHYKHIPFKNSLSYNKVLCIYEDSKDNIWVSTDGGGLNLFDPKTSVFTNYRHQPGNKSSICGDYVLSVREDYKNNLWIGTWADGITVFNRVKNSFKHFKNDPSNKSSLSSNNAWMIFEDKDKNMWIGTHGGGLNLYNPDNDSFTSYQSDENNPLSLSSNYVHSIFEDSEGYLWISTEGGGLNRFDKKKKTFTRFIHDDKKNSISNNVVGAVYEDGNGILWISTMVGLNSLDRKTNTFTVYTTKDGLPNNTVFGILEDNKKNLWISTNKGISRFNTTTKTFKNFGIADGLQSNEFKEQAYCKARSGVMYFGGNNGFNQFYPYSIRDITFEPPLVITGFQVFNKDVTIADDKNTKSPLKKDITETKEITLSYKNSVISFEFASLNYTSTEKKQYAYMLEGFDKIWNEVGTQRTATYTNLDAGKYIFKVKGMNNEGNWSEKITELKITITPPFWKTWWFRTISILVILGCFAAFYRMRMKAITNQKAQLEKQVKERTDEIVLQKEELSKNVQQLDTLKDSLIEEKYLLDSLMDTMPDAIYFKDRESKFVRVSKYMVNKHLANHPGATINDLIGKSDFDFQDEQHAKEAYEDEQEIQRTRKPKIDYIEKETQQDGSERWVATTKLPLINAQGDVVGTFGISRDITKLKILEEERHAAILDKAVSQGKFEIASDVMHDIGNAVVGFGSYLTRIRRLQDDAKPENLQNLTVFFEAQKNAIATAIGEAKADAVAKMLTGIAKTQKVNHEEINKSISEQLNIITNIQEILNIQRQYITGHESQERKPVNLRNIINDSLSMLFSSIDKMAIAVSLNIPSDLPIIKGDRTKLMQLILNILKNSIDAINKDATEKNIRINAFTKAGCLIIEVKDSGCGIDKSINGRVFEKGYSTKSAAGLGLYNCRAIAESHEATVDVTSKGLGQGATTTIGFKI